MITDEQLAEWQRLTNAARKGPWCWTNSIVNPSFYTVHATGQTSWPDGGMDWNILQGTNLEDDGATVLFGSVSKGEIVPSDSDLSFVCAARTAMPALIAEVKRLRETNK